MLEDCIGETRHVYRIRMPEEVKEGLAREGNRQLLRYLDAFMPPEHYRENQILQMGDPRLVLMRPTPQVTDYHLVVEGKGLTEDAALELIAGFFSDYHADRLQDLGQFPPGHKDRIWDHFSGTVDKEALLSEVLQPVGSLGLLHQ